MVLENPARARSDAPLAVLVNHGSASASEILAGALRDNGRLVALVGETTYGKGKIQSVFELDDGSALFVTVAKCAPRPLGGAPGASGSGGVPTWRRWLHAAGSASALGAGHARRAAAVRAPRAYPRQLHSCACKRSASLSPAPRLPAASIAGSRAQLRSRLAHKRRCKALLPFGAAMKRAHAGAAGTARRRSPRSTRWASARTRRAR